MTTELRQRILSAAILAPVVLGIVILGGWAFAALMALCFVIMLHEWLTITKPSPKRWLWALGGITYIGFACATLTTLRLSEGEAYSLAPMLYFLIAIVWGTDIGAYFVGRKFGRHKILPSISPKKSWEGLVGGMALAVLAVLGLKYFIAPHDPFTFLHVLIICFLAVIAQAGDFFESWVKRRFGVKDSGKLIPGHGGLLDRMDGILSVAWAVGIMLFLNQ